MAWLPDPREPNGMFEGPVVENCLTILTRDFKEAMDYYYPTEALLSASDPDYLPDFDERALGPPLRNTFPSLAIEPSRNTVDEADDSSHIVDVVRIRIYMAVTADSPNRVTRKIFKYVRVAHLVLQNARRDFFTGMSNPFGVILGFEHAYDVVRGDETIISRAAGIEVTVSLRER